MKSLRLIRPLAPRDPITFVDHLRWLADQRGDEPAITFIDRKLADCTVYSYAQLDRRARAIASRLQARTMPGDRVLLMLETGPAYVSSFLGCLYAEVVPVPVFPMDGRPGQHQVRLRGILRDADVQAVLIHAGTEASAAELTDVGQRAQRQVIAVEAIEDGEANDWRPRDADPRALALLQYTSGSTSDPKGVMVSHANLIANAKAMQNAFWMRPDDRMVSWLPLYHDMGLMGGLLQPLYAGAQVILMPQQLFLARPARWLETISAYRGTVSAAPDFAYRLCVDRISKETMAGLDLSSWELACSGSETVRAETLNAFAEKFAAVGFDARAFYPCYGQAEATLFVTGGFRGEGLRATSFDTAGLARNIAEPSATGTPIVACGSVQSEHEIRIADPETGEALGEGQIGEIWISGPVVAQGYWGNAEATSATFVDHGGQCFLRSGDLGFLQEGRLYIAGRRKDLIIIRGQNLFPQDIERYLETEIELLRNGRIAAFPVELDGREAIGVAVEVSRVSQKLVQPEALARVISEAVAENFFEPASVVLLLNPGGLPRTSSGKLQRNATRQGWLDGSLDSYAVIRLGSPAEHPSEAQRKVPPMNATQKRIAAILRDVLRQDVTSPEDSVFALGGTSIDAVQILSRINEDFDVELESAALFRSPTVRGLSDAVAIAQRGAAQGPKIASHAGDTSPLSYSQRRLWFLRELGGIGSVHHIAGGLRFGGALDRAALATALGGLVARHEALRTVFRRLGNGEAEQRVVADGGAPLAFEDLSDLGEARREAALAALSETEARQPFDLEAGPLLRATLARLAPDSHVLLVTLHHIIADGWSVRVLLGELLALYDAARRGGTAELAALPIRYADYAAWQRHLLDAGALKPQLEYWRQRLGDAPAPPIALPFDRSRPAVQSHRGGLLRFELGDDLAARLRGLAARRNVTLVTLMLAAFKVLLWRYSGETDLRLGLPAAGRGRRETEHVVGLFVNTLVIRSTVDGAGNFADLIAAVGETLIGAQAHQDLPFEQLVEALSPDRGLSHAPLIQVLYNHQPLALGQLPSVGGLAVEAFSRDSGGQQFDLVLETEERAGGGLAARFGYASDLFHEATIARMAGHFTALLDALTADPAARLDAVELVGPAELARLAAPYPLALNLDRRPVHELIAARAMTHPDAPAIICGDETVSFGGLDAEANRLAHCLLRQGVRPESRIGVLMRRSPRQIAALLAILKAGAAFLPLDSQQPPPRLAQILAGTGAALILTDGALAGHLPQADAAILDLDRLDLAGEPATAPGIAVHPEQLAYLISTSGSTGLPKAVAVAHGALSRHCQATGELYEMSPDSRELHFISLAFDGAHERWMTPLSFGGAIILRGEELWSAEQTLAAMTRHRATHGGFPTAYMQQIAGWAAADPAPPPPVRLYSFGGEAMPRAGFAAVKRALRPQLLINGYGPTEAVISPLAWKVGAEASFEGAYAPIGRAVGNRRAYVLDAGLNPVPQGVAGELYIGGDIARGYHDRPGLTAERFLPDPFAAGGARMLRTGDRVRQSADGTVQYLGRLDTQMKLRGFRIEPGEIEARLLDAETVSAAAVLLHDTPTGARLLAYAVPAPGAAPDPAALGADLARALPAYMVPSRILIIDAIPLTSTGKIDRARLPIPQADAPGDITPPETELEAQLAQIWMDVLKIPKIGTNQNFFLCGGDSLAALDMLARIRKLLPGREVTIADLFNNQTIRQLSAALTADAVGGVQVVHLRREGTRPILYCFPGLMVNTREYMPLVRHLGGDQPATGFVCYSLTEDAKRVVSVESIAERYADYIRGQSAGRPCVLLGWSWGGVLAFEAARMLGQDVDVRFVGMLDVINLDVNFAVGTLALIDGADRSRLERRIAAWLNKTPMRKDWEALFARMSPEGYTQFLRYVQTSGEALPSDGPGIGSKEYELWTFLDNTLLYQRYRMAPFDVTVHVWHAEDSVTRGLDLVDWRRYTPRVARREIIRGVTHREIVDAPAFHDSFRQSIELA
jgi:amino acid adenylation domain-containing protein